MKIIALSALLAVIISSCGSMMYSPTIAVTKQQLKKNELVLTAGAGAFPETRPQAWRRSTLGAYFSMGYGFSERMNLNVTGWFGAPYLFMGIRTGYSIHGRITLRTYSRARLELIPRSAVVFHRNVINGYGFEIAPVLVRDISSKWYYYIGAGPAVGFQVPKEAAIVPSRSSYPDGAAVIAHLGLGVKIVGGLSAILEIDPIYAYNIQENLKHILYPGTFSLLYQFPSKN